jgi:hypothetical protein
LQKTLIVIIWVIFFVQKCHCPNWWIISSIPPHFCITKITMSTFNRRHTQMAQLPLLAALGPLPCQLPITSSSSSSSPFHHHHQPNHHQEFANTLRPSINSRNSTNTEECFYNQIFFSRKTNLLFITFLCRYDTRCLLVNWKIL